MAHPPISSPRLFRTLVATALAALLLAPVASRAESPPQLLTVRFDSKALGGRQSYEAWLPPAYAAQPRGKTLPLIVLLHGLGGEGKDWFDPALGALGPALEDAMKTGVIPPAIVIAPQGGNGYWTDHLARTGKGRPRRYGAFIDEAIAHAEARFHGSGVRAIVGASMGGHGAMSRALMAPGRYVAVVSMAGALFTEPPTHRKIYKEVWGDPANAAHWAETAPMALMGSLPVESLPPIFLHCGKADLDRFLDLTLEAQRRLEARGVKPTVVLTEGGHGWTTWRSVTSRWLAWLGPYLAKG